MAKSSSHPPQSSVSPIILEMCESAREPSGELSSNSLSDSSRDLSDDLSDNSSVPVRSPIFDVVEPALLTMVKERFFNQSWAERLIPSLGALSEKARENYFLKFQPLPGNLNQPLALRYHGHQFRNYNPQLGDGRGFLYAQVSEPQSGRILDLGTKGSGRTPYSRGGDGRLTLKGAVREALATEMLESLGVETSKTFSIFETTEQLIRHDEPSPTRAAVLTRLSYGHIRFGTFQRLAYTGEHTVILRLVDYCLRHYYPEASHARASDAPLERSVTLLREVIKRSAKLSAEWMLAGFVHGVLNTDNMNISGESFDYGPYRFLPTYQPEFTAAYFDQTRLYAYGRQPEAVFWNLQQLAAALLAGRESDEAATQFGTELGEFARLFSSASISCFLSRMGIESESEELSDRLLMTAFQFLSASQIGFEQFFHDFFAQPNRKDFGTSPAAHMYKGAEFELLISTLAHFRASPSAIERRGRAESTFIFESPRPTTLLIDEIEQIWDLIAQQDDWSAFESKIREIRAMGQAYGRRQ